MITKNCPNCGKELPKEANFCPYCMTKLVDEKGVQIPKRKYKKSTLRKMVIVQVLVVIFLLSVLIATMIFGKNKNIFTKFFGNNKGTTVALNTKDKTTTKPNENMEQYLGLWQDVDNKSVKDVTKSGGMKIEICKVDVDNIVVSIVKVSSPMSCKTAKVQYITMKVVDGSCNFSFTDDEFSNAGYGTLTFSKNKIHAKISISKEDDKGQWDLSMDTDFVQVKKYTKGTNVEISNILGSYESEKLVFGERTEIITEEEGIVTYVFSKGLTIGLDSMNNSNVDEFFLDYDLLNGDFTYNYKGVDNTFDKKQVVVKLGKPTEKTNETYSYVDNKLGTCATIKFNGKGQVCGIQYGFKDVEAYNKARGL